MPRPIVPSPRDKSKIESKTMNRKLISIIAFPLYLQDKKWRPLENKQCIHRKQILKTGKKEGEFALSVSLNV